MAGRKTEKWAAVGSAVLSNVFGRSRSLSGASTVLSKNRMENAAEARVAGLKSEIAALEKDLSTLHVRGSRPVRAADGHPVAHAGEAPAVRAAVGVSDACLRRSRSRLAVQAAAAAGALRRPRPAPRPAPRPSPRGRATRTRGAEDSASVPRSRGAPSASAWSGTTTRRSCRRGRWTPAAISPSGWSRGSCSVVTYVCPTAATAGGDRPALPGRAAARGVRRRLLRATCTTTELPGFTARKGRSGCRS